MKRKAARGTSSNPAGRFERLAYECEPDAEPEAPVRTLYLRDTSKSIIAYNESPDVGFDASINPYRGCEHGCAYCYARPFHEYLGFSAGLDFETRILVKVDAPELLRKELSSPGWTPQLVALSGVTDPYQPIERRLQLTRRCLEILAEFRNPVGIVTKNHLVTRDLDVLKELNRFEAIRVVLSINSLETELSRVLEPRTSTPDVRLRAIRELSEAGIPCGVFVAPIIPGLTEHEVSAILEAAAETGAGFASYIVLRLPFGVRDLFADWLEEHVPERRQKVLHRIEDIRGGRPNDPNFHSRMRGGGPYAEQISAMFRLTCNRLGLERRFPALSTANFNRRLGLQMSLFP